MTANAATSASTATQKSVSRLETGDRYEAVSMVFTALAWMKTPGIPVLLLIGTSWWSPSRGSTAPMKTTFPARRLRGTRPVMTSTADTSDGCPAVPRRPSAQLSRRT